jgi:hypothetical protein
MTMQKTSSFQQAIETIESLPIDEQITLIDLMQNRLRYQRRQDLLQQVAEAEQAYVTGNVRKGTVADLMAELDG